MQNKKFLIPTILIISLALTACNLAPSLAPPPNTSEPLATIIPTGTETAQPTESPDALVFVYHANPELPTKLQEQISQANLPTGEANANGIAFSFEFSPENPIGNWVYALVVPFPTITDEVNQRWLKDLWRGEPQEQIQSLLISPESLPALTSLLGEPGENLQIIESDQLLETAWTNQNTWAIIPFEEIQPRWKVILIDGQSPLHKDFDKDQYALNATISITSEAEAQLPESLENLHFSNLDSSKITTVMLTGVTALVRGTAVGMEQRGILTPAEYLAPIMQEADILHISNEVPFAEECPPHWNGDYLYFCSDKSYMELLTYIGTDVVELTGDHFQDYGEEAMLYTLDLYEQNNIPYYGGGKDIFDARKPVKLEVNGNKFAFIGCNAKDPSFAHASENSTGAFHCDMDYMAQTTRELVSEGYLVIATFQHEEVYTWAPVYAIERDFQIMADAGAIIASGSQSHVPHFAEFWEDSFFHYGLGNTFFDQFRIAQNTDIGFLDRHVFYEGRYLGVELFPIKFLDKVQARLMNSEERAKTFQAMFDTSRMWWKDANNEKIMPNWQ